MRPWHARLVIFTDLDGTLLDPVTYSWRAAKPAMQACALNDIPVILNSSKTGAEMAHLVRQMDIAWPYIVENGGGIHFPKACPFQCIAGEESGRNINHIDFGVSYDHLCETLSAIATETGIVIRGFSKMSPDELMSLTGLNREDVDRASQRRYDEPFLIERAPPDALGRIRQCAGQLDLQITPGGRFYHLHSTFDKGKAVEWLSARLKPFGHICRVGIGDSENDIPMLHAVDIPVWVAPPEKPAPAIDGMLRSGEASSGPKAWNQVVLSLIRERYSL